MLCTQRIAGDTAGAKVAAEQARNTLEQALQRSGRRPLRCLLCRIAVSGLCRDGGEGLGPKGSRTCNHPLRRRAKDAVMGPRFEENLALIQTMFGEHSRAISTLTELLQTPYDSWTLPMRLVTPALLRLDPRWDPLRADPAFQKLCEQKPKTADK